MCLFVCLWVSDSVRQLNFKKSSCPLSQRENEGVILVIDVCVCGYGYVSISMLFGHNEGLPQWHQMRHMVSDMLLFHQHILDTFFSCQ